MDLTPIISRTPLLMTSYTPHSKTLPPFINFWDGVIWIYNSISKIQIFLLSHLFTDKKNIWEHIHQRRSDQYAAQKGQVSQKTTIPDSSHSNLGWNSSRRRVTSIDVRPWHIRRQYDMSKAFHVSIPPKTQSEEYSSSSPSRENWIQTHHIIRPISECSRLPQLRDSPTFGGLNKENGNPNPSLKHIYTKLTHLIKDDFWQINLIGFFFSFSTFMLAYVVHC